jgi:non-canonical poly(A) RNA polymerase PAPD5/7
VPTSQERIARDKAFAAIGGVVKKSFPNCEIRLFGSVTHDLCLPEGHVHPSCNLIFVDLLRDYYRDLDISIHMPELDPTVVQKTLYRLSGIFRNTGMFVEVNVIRWAKVPLVSLITVPELGLCVSRLN